MEQQTLTTWTADSILAYLQDHAPELRALGVRRIGLFGSYVRGDHQPGSDMDFLLEIDHWTWKRWSAVWAFLEDSFAVPIDLVPESDLRPELRTMVLAETRYVQNL